MTARTCAACGEAEVDTSPDPTFRIFAEVHTDDCAYLAALRNEVLDTHRPLG